MLRLRALRINVFAVLALVGAACLAALFAHVGIDLAGDVALAHDTYDGLDHRSRSDVFIVALTLAIGAMLRVVSLALDEVRTGRRPTQRPTLEDVFGPRPWRFVCAVVALMLPALMMMELSDIITDGRRLDDVSDLLGGSAWLGLGMAIPAAAVVALAVWSVAKLMTSSHRALVRVFGLLLALLARLYPHVTARSAEPNCGRQLRRRSILSRRSGKRGPPLRAA